MTFFMDRKTGFLCYETEPIDVENATVLFHRRFNASNLLNAKTVYDRPESRIAGILGEIVFGKWVGAHGAQSGEGNITYDFVVDGKKVDVKCKFRTVVPRPNFEASFFTYQAESHFKDVEYYAFLSTILGFRHVWFCGLVSKNKWLANPKGRLWKKGETDPSNGKTFHADTWSVFYRELEQFPLFFNGFRA